MNEPRDAVIGRSENSEPPLYRMGITVWAQRLRLQREQPAGIPFSVVPLEEWRTDPLGAGCVGVTSIGLSVTSAGRQTEACPALRLFEDARLGAALPDASTNITEETAANDPRRGRGARLARHRSRGDRPRQVARACAVTQRPIVASLPLSQLLQSKSGRQ